jgi:hypothetical protein
MSLSDADANLYRLYAVGRLSYEDALRQAQSVVELRRALLQFDQNARWRGKDGELPTVRPSPDKPRPPSQDRGEDEPQE